MAPTAALETTTMSPRPRARIDGSTAWNSTSAAVALSRMSSSASSIGVRSSDLPVAAGFGVSTAEQVREIWRFADAAVVGSAIVREIEKLAGSLYLVSRIGEFARFLLALKHTDDAASV